MAGTGIKNKIIKTGQPLEKIRKEKSSRWAFFCFGLAINAARCERHRL
jgi:hypothetical protein